MELIVAVYEDWGIGKDGTQPIALTADRKFFRETTRGAMVIVGSRTIEDFPGQKPLPGENGNDFAKRLCDEKYGEGNYPTGAGSEYNKIRKNGDRNK